MSYAAFAVLGLLVALRVVGTFAPTSWLWGVDTLAAAPMATKWMGLSLSLVAALAVLPVRTGQARPARSRRRESVAARTKRDRAARVLLWAGAGAAFLLVALLPCRHTLLGDGMTYVSAIDGGMHLPGPVHREPLPEAAMSAIHALVGGPAMRAFALTGIVLGALALLLAVRIAMRLSADAATRLVLFSAIALGGGLQLFARYAEYYAFALTAGLLFLWCALRWLARKGPLVSVTVSFVVAGLCHAIFLFIVPAVFYLAWLAWKRGERQSLLLALMAAPLVGVGLLALMHYPFGDILGEVARGNTFLPPLGASTERTAYSAFAPAHLVELVDLALLISPALLVLLPLATFARGPWSDVQRFAALLAPGPAFFVFFAQAELGTVRDWDFYVVPITLLTFALAVRVVANPSAAGAPQDARPGAPRGGIPRGLDLALLVTGLVSAAAWLQSNQDPLQARARLERTGGNRALFGTRSRGEIWRYLSAAAAADGDYTGAVRGCVNAIESAPDDPQNYRVLATYRIGQVARATGDIDAAVQLCIHDLEGHTYRAGFLYHGVALATAMIGRRDLSLWAAQKAVAAEPRSADLAATLGDALRRVGQDREARQAYEAGIVIAPDLPRARVGLAALAGIAGDAAALRTLAADALKRTPWSPQAQQFQRLVDSGSASTKSLRSYFYVR